MSVIRNNNNNNNNNRRKFNSNRSSNYRSNTGGISRGTNPAQIRKNATHNKAKYLDLAKNALLEDDKVTAENFFQHVHHYDTILQELDAELAKNPPKTPQNNPNNLENKQPAEKRTPRPPRQPRSQIPREEKPANVEASLEEKPTDNVKTSVEEIKPKRQPRKRIASAKPRRHEDISISEEEAMLILPQGIPGAVTTTSPKPAEKTSTDDE